MLNVGVLSDASNDCLVVEDTTDDCSDNDTADNDLMTNRLMYPGITQVRVAVASLLIVFSLTHLCGNVFRECFTAVTPH